MYHKMTDNELQGLVQKNLDLINLAHQDPTLDYYGRKDRVSALREVIFDVWVEQRFRTAMKIKVQNPIT